MSADLGNLWTARERERFERREVPPILPEEELGRALNTVDVLEEAARDALAILERDEVREAYAGPTSFDDVRDRLEELLRALGVLVVAFLLSAAVASAQAPPPRPTPLPGSSVVETSPGSFEMIGGTIRRSSPKAAASRPSFPASTGGALAPSAPIVLEGPALAPPGDDYAPRFFGEFYGPGFAAYPPIVIDGGRGGHGGRGSHGPRREAAPHAAPRRSSR